MKRVSVVFSVAVGIVALVAVSAHARLAANGQSLNGESLNGKSLNGKSLNGVASSGAVNAIVLHQAH